MLLPRPILWLFLLFLGLAIPALCDSDDSAKRSASSPSTSSSSSDSDDSSSSDSASLTAAKVARAPSSSRSPTIHRVTVGDGDFRYSPNVTIANVGDIVVFEFFPLNHSVTRGEFTNSTYCGGEGTTCNPCVPYETIHTGSTAGFSSGLIYVENFPSNPPTFNLTINDTDPIWFYCTAPGSCSPRGMVGVINPATNQSINAQETAATQAQFQLSPGQPWPSEGSPVGDATATATPSKSGLSPGGIAGVVMGTIALVGLLGAGFYFLGRSSHGPSFLNLGNQHKHMRLSSSDTAHQQHQSLGSGAQVIGSLADAFSPEKRPANFPMTNLSKPSTGRNSEVNTTGGYAGSPAGSGPPASQAGYYVHHTHNSSHGTTGTTVSSMHPAHYITPGGANKPLPHIPSYISSSNAGAFPAAAGQHFVGYNRQTGAPEFAAEAPADNIVEMPGDGSALRPQAPAFVVSSPSGIQRQVSSADRDIPIAFPDREREGRGESERLLGGGDGSSPRGRGRRDSPTGYGYTASRGRRTDSEDSHGSMGSEGSGYRDFDHENPRPQSLRDGLG